MLSLSESDIIDFSVPELYQGGERVEYNWRKIKWTCSNKKILKMKQEKQYQMLTYCKKDGTIIKRM